MYGLGLVLCVLVAGSWASTVTQSNAYVDNVLFRQLQRQLNARSLTVANLGNFHNEFKQSIGIIKTTVKTDYQKGNLTGLTQVYRAANCGVPYFTSNRANATLNCTLAFDNLAVGYEGKTKMGVAPAITIKARANATRTTVFFEVSTAILVNKPKLTRFQVLSLGLKAPTFTGAGPLNSVLKNMTVAFSTEATNQIHGVLAYQFSAALDAALGLEAMPKPLR